MTVAPAAMALSGVAWIIGALHQTADTERVVQGMKSETQGGADVGQSGA